ncbi:MAG: NAD-dependent epimerase/dehydratase family protein [Verrucomicrobiota bacterium]|nr:NAD-dependent epimerase/dehydratase family protein [Verrucomicrobiota bacterium]
MKVLVTGGGGFLGRHIVDLLLKRGDMVRILGRSPQPDLVARGVRVVQGDVSDFAAVEAAAKDSDAVFHVAAKAGVWGAQADYFNANVFGTRNVIEACRRHSVRYLVHTSTPSVVFNGHSFQCADESLPYGTQFLCHYAATKAQAEREALAAHQPKRLDICALRPHLIWGVGDPHLLPRVIHQAKQRRLRIVGAGTNRVDITHVANAAAAHLAALDALKRGVAGGKAYFLSQGEPVSLWPWINSLLAQLDLPKVTRTISARTAYHLGSLLEIYWRITRRAGEPPMTRFVAVELSKDHWFNIAAAQRDLGYTPSVSTENGLADYVAHLRAQEKQAP